MVIRSSEFVALSIRVFTAACVEIFFAALGVKRSDIYAELRAFVKSSILVAKSSVLPYRYMLRTF